MAFVAIIFSIEASSCIYFNFGPNLAKACVIAVDHDCTGNIIVNRLTPRI